MPAAGPLRPFALVRTRDQWLRLSHEGTALDAWTDALQLDFEDPPPLDGTEAAPVAPGGLAFDSRCRLYRAVPEEGRLERSLWAGGENGEWVNGTEDWLGLPPQAEEVGGFVPAELPPSGLALPRGLAVDADDRLYVAESGHNRVLVLDLWSRRLLRRVAFGPKDAAGPRPVDLAARGSEVIVAVQNPASLYRMGARRGPAPWLEDFWGGLEGLSRIATSPSGTAVLLFDAGTPTARIAPAEALDQSVETPFATDLEFESDEVLVIARQPGADFLRLDARAGRWGQRLTPAKARGYDGRGIVRLPGSTPRVGYWTEKGFRVAVPARVEYRRCGRAITFRLDSGEFQTRWGRLFLDACVPPGATLGVGFITRDEAETDEAPLAATPPPRHAEEVAALPPGTPPMPLPSEVAELTRLYPLHRREVGPERPWARPPETDEFQTFEAPIAAPPGRYLWVVLELGGNTRVTPRVRCLRAEYPAHDLLRRLPRTFSRDERVASFLQRYLAPLEGMLSRLDAQAAGRHVLLDPRAAPPELLPWLASFIGLVLDQRWPERARRRFVQEAATLFRFRGTKQSLERMIEIVTDVRPVILEHFQLRGLSDVSSNAVLGGGFRVGGRIGEPGEVPLEGTAREAFAPFAHRFTVLIPKVLGDEELAMVRHLLDVHRPAHTLYELCTLDAGMRIGRGLLLGVSTLIGRTGGFDTLQVGSSTLGIDRIVGRPVPGTVPGQSRLGHDTRVG